MGEENGTEQIVRNQNSEDKSQEQSYTGHDDIRKQDVLSDIPKMSNKMNENNNHSTNETNKRSRTICYDFKKGLCRRRFCRVSKLFGMDVV